MIGKQALNQFNHIRVLAGLQKGKQIDFLILVMKLSGRVEIAHYTLRSLLCLFITTCLGQVLQKFLQSRALVHDAVMAGMQHIQG